MKNFFFFDKQAGLVLHKSKTHEKHHANQNHATWTINSYLKQSWGLGGLTTSS